jgi:molybdate transport system substrate-binding protein
MRVLLAFLLLSCSSFAGEVRVFAAASLTDGLKEVAARYEKKSGDKVVFNFGASNFLARQIEAGAPADVFFSADQARMDDLERKGLLSEGSRRNRLSNSLVIVIASDSVLKISNAQDLASANVKRIALADPAGVPAGIYAKRYLEKAGVWTLIQRKVVPLDNVRAALAAVEAGNADAAIVYRTDAAISKKTKVAFEVPREQTPEIVYPVALLMEARNASGARKFLDFLFSAEATETFRKFGFD